MSKSICLINSYFRLYYVKRFERLLKRFEYTPTMQNNIVFDELGVDLKDC